MEILNFIHPDVAKIILWTLGGELAINLLLKKVLSKRLANGITIGIVVILVILCTVRVFS